MGAIGSLREITDRFDVAVLDQWGVLHDGTRPYEDAVDAVAALKRMNKRVVVLSNSGKRASSNAKRIEAMGFDLDGVETVTSGEALWDDAAAGRLAPFSHPFAIEGRAGDAASWAEGLQLRFASRIEEADAVLAMSLPDGVALDDYRAVLDEALERGLPLICANPDRASPRAGGGSAVQPGTLAHHYSERGGTVRWYGKPHAPVFEAVMRLHPDTPPARFVMVGDSPEHDVAGARAAGWIACLVRGGLHAGELREASDGAVRALCARLGAPEPDVHIAHLAA